ncbi:MAG: imm11 family protein [Hyphomicrobiaceae bacterium]
MVWGMALPGKFGEFFPDGNYVGWKDELTAYFDNQMSAERKALFEPPIAAQYIYYAAMNLITEPGLKHEGIPPFGPIAAHEAPKRFECETKYVSLGALTKLTGQILAVDESLKNVIESVEPGVHHFSPIEITMLKKIYPKKYFVIAIRQYLDSFLPEKSDPGSWGHSSIDGFYHYEEDKRHMARLAMSRDSFGNAHLWCERRMSSALVCFSNQLITEITRLGLRLPKHFKLKEV